MSTDYSGLKRVPKFSTFSVDIGTFANAVFDVAEEVVVCCKANKRRFFFIPLKRVAVTIQPIPGRKVPLFWIRELLNLPGPRFAFLLRAYVVINSTTKCVKEKLKAFDFDRSCVVVGKV